MVIIFIVMLVYIIILQKRVRQVNHQEKMRENRRLVLYETGRKLLEIEIGCIEKGKKSERDVLLKLEIVKYIKDYLLKAMRDGNFDEWGKDAMHGYVVQEYPEIFEVFEKER